jgi:hypothetical protein
MSEGAPTHARSEIQWGLACLALAIFVTVFSCAPNHPIGETPTKTAPVEPHTAPPPPPPPTVKEQPSERRTPSPEPLPLEGSGHVVWAEGFKGLFIAGLDGGLYYPYSAPTMKRVQRTLTDRGLYNGPVNGILDRPTMLAIYAFQQANRNLLMCGVPTPRTRKLLEQGSHTDVVS